MQKSIEGLFRTLLHQIFEKAPDLIPLVCPNTTLGHRDFVWDHKNLEIALKKVASLSLGDGTTGLGRFKLCLFIDGLDEYHQPDGGDCDGRIVKVVESLVRCSGSVKICVSSRSWTVFRRAFEAGTFNPSPSVTRSRMLEVENFTRRDMQEYAWKQIQDEKPAGDPEQWVKLSRLIAQKAEGVWIWTRVVVRSILPLVLRNESFDSILLVLESYSSELDTLYRSIMDSIDPRYKKDAAMILSIAAVSTAPIFAADIRLFLIESPDPVGLALKRTPNLNQFDSDLASLGTIRDRLNNRCRDFLQIVSPHLQTGSKLSVSSQDQADSGLNKSEHKNSAESECSDPAESELHSDSGVSEHTSRPKPDSIYTARVEFVHRSIPEFLKKDNRLEAFRDLSGPHFCPRLYAMAMIVTTLKYTKSHPYEGLTYRQAEAWFEAQFFGFFSHASALDREFRDLFRTSNGINTSSKPNTSMTPLGSSFEYDRNTDVGKRFISYIELISQMEILEFAECSENKLISHVSEPAAWGGLVDPYQSSVSILLCSSWPHTSPEKEVKSRWHRQCWELNILVDSKGRVAWGYYDSRYYLKDFNWGGGLKTADLSLVTFTKARLLLFLLASHQELWNKQWSWQRKVLSELLYVAAIFGRVPSYNLGDFSFSPSDPLCDIELLEHLLQHGADISEPVQHWRPEFHSPRGGSSRRSFVSERQTIWDAHLTCLVSLSNGALREIASKPAVCENLRDTLILFLSHGGNTKMMRVPALVDVCIFTKLGPALGALAKQGGPTFVSDLHEVERMIEGDYGTFYGWLKGVKAAKKTHTLRLLLRNLTPDLLNGMPRTLLTWMFVRFHTRGNQKRTYQAQARASTSRRRINPDGLRAE